MLAVALGVWHASSLLVALHSMLGLSQNRWTQLLRLADTLAVTSVTLTYSFCSTCICTCGRTRAGGR